MRAVVDRFAEQVNGYLILEGMALGQIYHRGLGVQRYKITAETAGGHSWVDYGKPSAVHELVALINRLVAIPLAKHPRTTLNVGVVSGGTSVNTIAAQACCLLDLRSEQADTLQELSSLVEAMIRDANRPTVRLVGEIVGHRPAGMLPLSHPMVRLAINCLEVNGIQPHPNIGSTDANLPLSRGLPAICLGLTSGAGAHTTNEYIETRPLERACLNWSNLSRDISPNSG
jgi:acetylornithine deacetylase/succinyl-diaminopimelate desuccinylase-like protein